MSKLIGFFTSNVCILLYVNYTITTTKEEDMRSCSVFRVYSGKQERKNKREVWRQNNLVMDWMRWRVESKLTLSFLAGAA